MCIFPAVKKCVCLIFGLLLLPVFGNEPGAVAIAFLEKVRAGEIDLTPGTDTALQDHTSKEKRKQIRKHLARLGVDLQGGSLELGEVKEDENFAAVIVKRVDGFDSSRMQIVPVALVFEGEKWHPAPVPASFENAVAGYSIELGARLGKLEDWMSRKRVTDLDDLIAEAVERTRREILENISEGVLEGNDLGEITESFIAACAEGNRAAVLGFLGGLRNPLPADWVARLKASEVVSKSGPTSMKAWRLLISPDVIRSKVNEEVTESSGLVSIACLDPAHAASNAKRSKIALVHLEFSKDPEGRWSIDLPTGLLRNDVKRLAADEVLDADLLDRFAENLTELEPVAVAENAGSAKDEVLAALRHGGVQALLRRVDFSGTPENVRYAAVVAAQIWFSMNDSNSPHFPVELGFKQEGKLAAAAFQWFSPANPDSFELRTLFFRQNERGWLWAPGERVPTERKVQKSLSAWVKRELPDWRISWRETLLAASTEIETIDFAKLPTNQQVETLLGEWLSALEHWDLGAALGMSAWLGGEEKIPTKALRNLSYDFSQARNAKIRLLSIERSDSWVAAVVGPEGEMRKAFLPVLLTQEGPKTLPGIDLIAGDSRTRKFLNEASFNRIEQVAGAEKTKELRELFAGVENATDPEVNN